MFGVARRILLVALALFPVCARAISARADGATLLVNESRVLTLKGTVAGYGPDQRASLAAKRLMAIQMPVELKVTRAKTAHLLVANGNTILQIDPSDAKAYASTTAALAVRWRGAVEQALSLPPLRLSKGSATLAPGRAEGFELIGSEAQGAAVSSSDPQVAVVERAPGGLTVRGVGVGEATVSVLGATGEATIAVKVLPLAASFPQTLSAEVVGVPTSPETIAATVRGAIQTGLAAQPSATLSIANFETAALGIGETRTVKVRVKAEAAEAFPAEGDVLVRVVNLGLAKAAETELWYCNDPEQVKAPQELFRATLAAGRPARMLYHHINDTGAPLELQVNVLNGSTLPARVAIIPGDAKPHRNPVVAGLDAADVFLREWLGGSGEVVTIPPGTSLPLALRKLAHLDTASGLCYLRLLPGGPASLKVVTIATEPTLLDTPTAKPYGSPTPWRESRPREIGAPVQRPGPETTHVYPDPFKTESVTYRVGGNFGFFRVGQKPIPRKNSGRGLDGNFGVVYRVAARAENPTNLPANVEVVFESSAGYSGALFVVDGQIRKVSPLQPKGEVQLARFRLEPGQSRDVSILTIPLSGSSYPATLVVRPVSTLKPIGG
ncbi:MAG: hypothetical protein ACO1SV_06545 [Fimbriimonas sp.]